MDELMIGKRFKNANYGYESMKNRRSFLSKKKKKNELDSYLSQSSQLNKFGPFDLFFTLFRCVEQTRNPKKGAWRFCHQLL